MSFWKKTTVLDILRYRPRFRSDFVKRGHQVAKYRFVRRYRERGEILRLNCKSWQIQRGFKMQWSLSAKIGYALANTLEQHRCWEIGWDQYKYLNGFIKKRTTVIPFGMNDRYTSRMCIIHLWSSLCWTILIFYLRLRSLYKKHRERSQRSILKEFYLLYCKPTSFNRRPRLMIKGTLI